MQISLSRRLRTRQAASQPLRRPTEPTEPPETGLRPGAALHSINPHFGQSRCGHRSKLNGKFPFIPDWATLSNREGDGPRRGHNLDIFVSAQRGVCVFSYASVRRQSEICKKVVIKTIFGNFWWQKKKLERNKSRWSDRVPPTFAGNTNYRKLI